MKLLNQTVKDAFGRALKAAFPSLTDVNPIVAASKFGDFQCNSALVIWKKEGKALGLQSAKEAAEKVAEHLRKDAQSPFSTVQVSPQGFLTADVAASWLQEDLVTFLQQQQQLLPPLSAEEKKKVIVDFSSPNVAKEMHVGHLRSTIIGESICRILEFRGHEVERVNHVGDWGTQFGMLIEYLHTEFPDYKNSMPDISDLNAFYKKAKAAFDASEDFKRRSRERVVKLQGGDEATLESWRLICEISRKEFDKVYQRLGVKLEERGESAYNDVIPSIVKELTDKGMVTESDGAKCIFTSAEGVPLFLVKSDGGYGYDTTDLAAVNDRLIKRKANWVIYVTDLGQEDHFMKIFAAATTAKWHQPPLTRLDHVGFGVVQGQDGKRFKTRSGETVKLVDLLDEATARALKELLRRKAEEDALNSASTSGSNSNSSNGSNTSTNSSSADGINSSSSNTTSSDSAGSSGSGPSKAAGGDTSSSSSDTCDSKCNRSSNRSSSKESNSVGSPPLHPPAPSSATSTSSGATCSDSSTTAVSDAVAAAATAPATAANVTSKIITAAAAPPAAAATKEEATSPPSSHDQQQLPSTKSPSKREHKDPAQQQERNDEQVQNPCIQNGVDETTAAIEATEEMKKAAEAIGYSAVKYFDLKQNRNTDYKFSYDRMLDPKGNTAVYMLYAYARICAIFRKAGIDPQLLDPKELQLVEPGERKLALLLAQFPDVVCAILEDLHVHRLAEYMYKVAGAFTEFYQTCKVLGVPQQNSRLLLSECTRKILQTCFHLLGITPLQRL